MTSCRPRQMDARVSSALASSRSQGSGVLVVATAGWLALGLSSRCLFCLGFLDVCGKSWNIEEVVPPIWRASDTLIMMTRRWGQG